MLLTPMRALAEQAVIGETAGLSGAVLAEATTMSRLWAESADTEFAVAGLSKLPAILTIAQAMDEGSVRADTVMRVSTHAASIPGPTAFLDGGEEIGAGELFKAAVMISAGDAIMTLGENAYGSESVFVENINVTLRQLGIEKTVHDALGTDTLFTVWELTTLGAAAAGSAAFSRYAALYYDGITHADGRETELVNANRLLNNYAGCVGVMTGSSASDGYCGVFYTVRNRTALIAVVIGAESAAKRASAAVALMDYGFANFRTETVSTASEVVVKGLPVRDGTVKSVDLVTRSTRTVVIEGRQGKLTAERTVPEYLEAPLTASTPVGSVSYRNEAGEVVAEVPLFPACDVEAFALLDILMRILAIYLA